MTEPHVKSDIRYHFVWCTKYRAKILTGDIGVLCHALIKKTCERNRFIILDGAVAIDHVHIVLQCPASLSPSEIMNRLKGAVSRELLLQHPELSQNSHLWARGFYVASVGRVDPNYVSNYLNKHVGVKFWE